MQNCAKCETFQKHIEIATEVRSSYQNQMIMPRNKMTVSVDMQKVIMLSRLPDLKQAIFCKCLVLFNETFALIEKLEMKPAAVLWHEAIKDRSADDVASTFTFFIRNF